MSKTIALVKTTFILIACFLTTFTLGCSIPKLVGAGFWSNILHSTKQIVTGEKFNGEMNVLLLGIDARKGETMTRSDTIMLAHIDKKNRKVAIVSIPRDTRVEVPGSPVPKINSACAVGGPEMACRVVSDLMGQKVDKYVLTNFSGFKDIIDTLGGVTINVEQRMLRRSEGINLRPGVQRLNGEKALAYVRFRGYAQGDIARTEHQQKFMMALANEMFKTGTILKLPKLVPQLADNVKTNLSLSDMVSLAEMARSFKPENLYAQTLPGYFYTQAGISYWVADKKVASTLLDDLIAGKKVAVVEESPYPEVKKPPRRVAKPKKITAPVSNTPEYQPGDSSGEQYSPEDNGGTTPYPPDDQGIPGGSPNPNPNPVPQLPNLPEGTTSPSNPDNPS